MKKFTIFSLIVLLMISGGNFNVAATTETGSTTVSLESSATVHSASKYIVKDALNDAFAADKELKEMVISANSSGLLVSIKGNITNGGGTHLFIDTDPGQETGFVDPSSGGWNRPFTFNGTGFGAEYWAAGWMQNFGDLWNSTPSVVDDNNAGEANVNLAGYDYVLDAAAETKYYYFAWDLLYPTSVPSFAELGIVAVVVGDSAPGVMDTIPSQEGVLPEDGTSLVTVNEYLFVNVTDTATGELAETPEVGYLDLDSSNLSAGNLTAGNPFIGIFNVWINELGVSTNTVSDQANSSTIIEVEINIERSGVNTTINTFAYKEFGGRVGQGSDKHVLTLDATNFQAGDKVFWDATATREASDIDYDTGASGFFYVAPLPALQVGFVGGIQPSGGFVAPNEDVLVTAQVNFHAAGDDQKDMNAKPSTNLPVNVTISWMANNSGVWTDELMEWKSFASNNNNYEANLGQFVTGNLTYYITAYVLESNNANATEAVLASDTFTVLVGIEPTRNSVFAITDFADDLSLLLPASPADPWDEAGIIDIVNFEVLANEFNVEFRLTFTNLINPWGGTGFTVVIFSIYIDSVAGGQTGTMWNERVTTSTGWEWALKADGFVPEIYDGADTSAPLEGTGMQQLGNITTNQASIVIPVSVIGAPTTDWSYFVMAGSDDFNKYRQAGADHGGDWQLGGGEAGEIDPNVIDMIVPTGGDATLQDFLLDGYDTSSATLAEVLPVGTNEAFVADTVDPTATIAAVYDGSAVTDGATITTATETASVDLTITVADTDTSVLSGLDRVEVFDGNVLVQQFSGLDGLTDTLTLTVTLDPGVRVLKVNVFDITGNFASVEFTITVDSTFVPSTTTTTTTSEEKDSDDGFLPIGIFPVVMALLSASLIAIYRKRK